MANETSDRKQSILNVMQMIVLVGPLFKSIFDLVKEAEDPNLSGDQKKQGVLAFVGALLKAAATKVAGIDDKAVALAQEAAGWVIEGYVAFKNALGHFVHKEAQP